MWIYLKNNWVLFIFKDVRFPWVTLYLAGRRFATDADVKRAAPSWLQTLDADFIYAEIQALATQWEKCLNIDGDHVEVWCVPSATHESRLRRCQSKVLDISVCYIIL